MVTQRFQVKIFFLQCLTCSTEVLIGFTVAQRQMSVMFAEEDMAIARANTKIPDTFRNIVEARLNADAVDCVTPALIISILIDVCLKLIWTKSKGQLTEGLTASQFLT